MTLTELKVQIDEIVDWAEKTNTRAGDVHVFVPNHEGEWTENIELRLSLGMRRRVYISPK